MTRWLLVTGKLARPFVDQVAQSLTTADRQVEVATLPISVAALMTTRWIARHLTVPQGVHRVILPGLCQGTLDVLENGKPYQVSKGPVEIWDLTELEPGTHEERPRPHITIVAEIQNAPQWELGEICRTAQTWRENGVDIVDLGIPQEADWPAMESVIRELHQNGLSVSVDSLDPAFIERAIKEDVDLILSATWDNRHVCTDAKQVVAIWEPEDTEGERLDETVNFLEGHGVSMILDPILGTPGLDLAYSLERTRRMREKYPRFAMMWGIHHVTEFVQADSIGINAAFFMLATEFGVTHLLTTEVASWTDAAAEELARVQEFWRHAPGYWLKGGGRELLVAKSPKHHQYTAQECSELQRALKDRNFRILTGKRTIWCFNRDVMLELEPSEVEWAFSQLQVNDAPHSFYLGHELARAAIAVVLGKPFRQDNRLDFGYRNRRYGTRGMRTPVIGHKRGEETVPQGDQGDGNAWK